MIPVSLIALRKLSVDDARDSELIRNLVRVFCEARRARLAFLMEIHDAEEDRRFLSGVMLAQNDVGLPRQATKSRASSRFAMDG